MWVDEYEFAPQTKQRLALVVSNVCTGVQMPQSLGERILDHDSNERCTVFSVIYAKAVLPSTSLYNVRNMEQLHFHGLFENPPFGR
jgi:hypothetical protein